MVPLLPESPERFSAANGTIVANNTIGGNVGTSGTISSPNGTIGKPNGVNSNIMIKTSNLFLYSHFLCVHIISENHPDKTMLIVKFMNLKFKAHYWIM